MNTNALKKFAQAARKKLLNQVGSKLEQVLSTDSIELREKTQQIKRLQEEINRTGKEQVIDKVAYTWFNRLMALRFMDANDYQPIGVNVITPKSGYTLPELLDEAKQGHIPDDLPIKKQHVFDLLDGRIPSSNPQNEAYKELLVGACNHLSKVFPFLFERIDDYSELLLPDDITSEFSIVQDVRNGMTIDDCKEVEIIGWLYQFYISEKKDEVFASGEKVKKEDIPAATQLFTPRWIVEYMVQNTVGKLWLQNRPNSRLKDHMPYFIDSPSLHSDDYLKINSVEDLTLLDQACGSGHILVYGFELFSKIYEEEGYNQSEIPKLIIEKNLHGFEIDERAAQLAGFALMMKAREYQKRVFRKDIHLNILCFSDLKLSTEEIAASLSEIGIEPSDELLYDLKNMQHATNLGSLIIPQTDYTEILNTIELINAEKNHVGAFNDFILNQLSSTLPQLSHLSKKHCCIVNNPPYMISGKMNKKLGDFVKSNFPESWTDLMACFIEVGLHLIKPKGFLGMINQQSWMFLSSYEKLREKLIDETFIDSMLHLGPRTFPEISGEVVQNTSFTIFKSRFNEKGHYFRLVEYSSSENKRVKTIEAIRNTNSSWIFITNQKKFKNIPGNVIGYWAKNNTIKLFKQYELLSSVSDLRSGISTGDNERFYRHWSEVEFKNVRIDGTSKLVSKNKLIDNRKWYATIRGGEYIKWFGNQEYVLNLQNNGYDIRNSGKNHRLRTPDYYFKEGITWSRISSGKSAFRIKTENVNFGENSPCLFSNEISNKILLGILNSPIPNHVLEFLSPTLSFQAADMGKIPIPDDNSINSKLKLIENCIDISKENWDIRESSWNFNVNSFIQNKGQDIKESFVHYKQYWKDKHSLLQKNEEQLNAQLIEIYGLQNEITSDVPLEEITILKEETSIIDGRLVFNDKEVFTQFMSYAVGCMFGRYSLHKEGLILANQGETLEDYLNKIGLAENEVSFLPDDDNIIPILDDEWFEDDIVGRFYEFLKVTFGKENFEKNLAFVEECLGKDIRKFFVKDFYTDHIKRYKKRPIYWMFSSPKGSFNVLIYMHRYTPDTLNQILNGYLKEYREKLKTRAEHLDHIIETGSSTEQIKAEKEKDKLRNIQLELQEYERDILYPLATERIPIDLDDGVLVNYNKFGKAIKEVSGLNDKKTKDKVKKFDWIDTELIR